MPAECLVPRNVLIPVCDCCQDLYFKFLANSQNVHGCHSDCYKQLEVDVKLNEDDNSRSFILYDKTRFAFLYEDEIALLTAADSITSLYTLDTSAETAP